MKKQTLIVNLFGGPCTGKSTIAAGVFSLLKLHGIEIELVTEFAKDLVWEKRKKTFKDQLYIFAKQNHRIWRLLNKVDVVISDSPILFSVIYQQENNISSFTDYVVDLFNSYNNINILLDRTIEYNPTGRNQNMEEAKIIDTCIKETLDKYKIKYYTVSGDYENINIIANKVLKKQLTWRLSKNKI